MSSSLTKKSNRDYKQYKEALRKEFLYTCVYCGTREPEIGGSQSFHIDHYRPKSKFPKLVNAFTNLLYACRYCNAYKGNYWPNWVQRMMNQFILNPREDEIDSHIDYSKHVWVGKSTRGKWNVEKLRLSSPILETRRRDRDIIEKLINKFEACRDRLELALINARAVEGVHGVTVQNMEHDLREQNEQIATLRRKIAGPMD